MSMAFEFKIATFFALTFMEERFGKINAHVIEFRKKNMREADEKFEAARQAFTDCGGLDVVLKRLNEKELG
jgi:hypothetical protein